MPAPASVVELVERFEKDRKVFRSSDKEEQLRLEFLNPWFESLNWDVSNKAGLTEVFKPVIHEEPIKVAGATKAPDYTFRIGGRRVFFAEAKKPRRLHTRLCHAEVPGAALTAVSLTRRATPVSSSA